MPRWRLLSALNHRIKIAKGRLRAIVASTARDYSLERVRISYPHIGVQTLMPPAQAKLVRADIRKKGDRIGYIPGAAMMFRKGLGQIGYSVKMLSEPEITAKNLAQFSAVVLGIRAYNTQDRISNWLPELFAYVKKAELPSRSTTHSRILRPTNSGRIHWRFHATASLTKMHRCVFWRRIIRS
jgi:hypothetical protein